MSTSTPVLNVALTFLQPFPPSRYALIPDTCVYKLSLVLVAERPRGVQTVKESILRKDSNCILRDAIETPPEQMRRRIWVHIRKRSPNASILFACVKFERHTRTEGLSVQARVSLKSKSRLGLLEDSYTHFLQGPNPYSKH